MPTIFGKDKDAIVTALRQCCSKRETGCINCPYDGRCYDLHPDAVDLAYSLVKALDYIPRMGMLDTLKNCDTCSINDANGCIFHKINGPKACDKIQSDMADYIEELYSKFLEKYPLSEITKEDKNMDPTFSKDNARQFWIRYNALREAEERRRSEIHYTPKSIEQSADHKTVVVIWTDNTKTIVRLSPNDPDDIYMAFTAALAKKILGSNSKIKKVIRTHLNEHKPKKKKTEGTVMEILSDMNRKKKLFLTKEQIELLDSLKNTTDRNEIVEIPSKFNGEEL